jgi:hypothetical protein
MKSAPARSLAEDGTDFERRLLASARGDGISAAARDRLARALNVPSAAPTGTIVHASRAKWRAVSSSAVRWSVCGLVGAAAAAIGAQRWSSEPAPTEAESAPVEVSAPAPAAPVLATPAALQAREAALLPPEHTSPLPTVPLQSMPVPAVSVTKGGAAGYASARATAMRAVPRGASPPAPAAGSSQEHGLRAEVRAVEAIQQALRAGRASDAERGLDDYSRRFPRGELAIEAELLRIDLELSRGDRVSASARARALIALPSAGRYRERLEALTQGD